MAKQKIPPMLAQYFQIKKDYQECLVFFRLGDFYELFFEDAQKASKTLDLVLTHRGELDGEKVPMCGIPFHAYENYLVRLIKAGFKVAICDQLETPEDAKKRGAGAVIRRDVTRVVTAGTLTEETLLDARTHNYLAALVPTKTACAVAWVDISTGDFNVEEINFAQIPSVLTRIGASELLLSEDFEEKYHVHLDNSWGQRTYFKSFEFADSYFKEAFEKFPNLKYSEQRAAGLILRYLDQTQLNNMPQLAEPQEFVAQKYMAIDGATRRSLELTTTLSDEVGAKSLLSAIDNTLTGAGARLLAAQLNSPLVSNDDINIRLDRVEYFVNNPLVISEMRALFKNVGDVERSFGRLAANRGGPRDMRLIAESLNQIPALRNRMYGTNDDPPLPIMDIANRLGLHSEMCDRILRYIRDDSPLLARDGGFIKQGASAVLDDYLMAHADSKKMLSDLQYQYMRKTGIQGLKVSFNNLIGYFVEVPAKQSDALFGSDEFIHRQSTSTVVRFTTEKLAELADKILHAQDRRLAIELELYEELRQDIMARGELILASAQVLAELDISVSLAELALQNKWVRPKLNNSNNLKIIQGRHPVVESALNKTKDPFIPNNCEMDEKSRLWLLTGPNMAGKSTFLRQNALIAIMAQIGSFVPAAEAEIGIVDRIFSRVGASDDLARGRSTFMVEMVEVANILNNATDKSLVILDEVGRGTATYDGLSLAWAVVEYLHNVTKARALFATHYHELTALSGKLKHMVLYTMQTKEWGEDVVFMHRVIEGAATRSFGIHVAKLAGLPHEVTARASLILAQLEEKKKGQKPILEELPLFSAAPKPTYQSVQPSAIEKMLKDLDVDALSPREALDMLYQLKKEIK